jgi:hypothetical protein
MEWKDQVIRLLRREFDLMETPTGKMNMSRKRLKEIEKKIKSMGDDGI